MNIPFTEIKLGFYNLLSCRGFEVSEKVGLSFGPCAQAKLCMVFLFFINAIVRKWGGEEIDVDYSFWGGLIGGLGLYFLFVSFTGSIKISFVLGLIGMLIGGYCGGMIFGDEED